MDSLSLYLRLVSARIRGQMQYRVSFVLDVLSNFLITFVDLIGILVLFATFHDLAGWRVGEVVVLYGVVGLALGIATTVGAGFDEAATLVRLGEFDRLLTRPLPVFVQVMASDFQLRRLGRTLQAAVALGIGLAWADVAWSAASVGVLLAAVVGTTLVFLTVLVIGATLCFWTVETSEVQNIFTYGGSELGSFPVHIYSPWLRLVFVYAVPLALTSYYPALYVLRKPDPLGGPSWLSFVGPLASAAFFILGLAAWGYGIRHYRSTGS